MWFDKELMFAEKKALTDFSGGVVGDPVDIGTKGAVRGRQAFVAVTCGADMTATGDPAITFALESSETADFLEAAEIPLSLPPKKKADFPAGAGVVARLPYEVTGRYLRLKMTATAAVTCADLTAGIVLDA